MIKDFDIKPVLTSVKNPQSNAPVEKLHQLILNMRVTKDLYNKVFYYIDPWGETLASIAWVIRSIYHRTIMATLGQAIFGRDILFNLSPVVEWRVATDVKLRQVDIDNVRENDKRFTHDYAIGDQFYVEMKVIYRKLYYKKQGLYIITELFTNGTVRVQRGQVNGRIKIRRLKPHFDE